MSPDSPLTTSRHVKDGQLVVTRSIRILLDEFQITFARSGGPGGQNVNKRETKAILRWPVTASSNLRDDVRERFMNAYGRRITAEGELVLTSQRYRDQARNIEDCLEKLREMIAAAAVRPKPRKATKPTRASKERRMQSKRERTQKKQQRQSPRFD